MSELAMTTTTVSTPDTGPGPAASPPSSITAPAGERPTWLPEKFKTPEALVASYAALEQRLGAAPAATTPAAPTTPAATSLTLTAPVVVAKTATDTLNAAYAEAEGDTKAVSAATYDKLAASGIDRTTVDTMIAGKRALLTSQKADVHAAVGGPEAYTTMAAWAVAGGFDAAQMTAYNAIMSTGNPAIMKVAAAGLAAAHAKAVGSEGTPIGGVPTGGKAEQGAFKSMAEQTEAINNPLYKRDPAYREMVSRRIALTP